LKQLRFNTLGSATDFNLGLGMSVLIVGRPKTLSSSPSFTVFLKPCLVALPSDSSSLTCLKTASPVMHLATFHGSLSLGLYP